LASAAAGADPAKPAADAPPGVHKMVVLSGGSTAVHYFGQGLSPGEDAALRDLERAENEANQAADLQALRRQYVADEQLLQARRTAVQFGLYGRSITDTTASAFAFGGYGGYYGGYYPWYGYGYGSFGAPYGFVADSRTVNQSLANGVGDEGRIKEAMAQVVAAASTPEASTAAARAYTAAIGRAAESDNLRAALNLGGKGGVAAAAAELSPHVKLTLKDGDKTVEGTLVSEDADWITVDTGNKEEVSVRKADVTRITRVRDKK
jgi:hypothetical protein